MDNNKIISFAILEEYARDLLRIFRDNFIGFTFTTDFQRACFSMLRRVCTQVRAIHLLIKKKFPADATIIARSLLNQYWSFLFLCNAKHKKKG